MANSALSLRYRLQRGERRGLSSQRARMLNKNVSEVHEMERTEAQAPLTTTVLVMQAVTATKAAAGGQRGWQGRHLPCRG